MIKICVPQKKKKNIINKKISKGKLLWGMRNQPGKKNSTTVLKTEIFLYFRVCMFECSNKHYFFF